MFVVLDAPSNLGLRPPAPEREPGCRHLAAALRSHDLVERLGARDAGVVRPPPYSPEFDTATGVRNGAAIVAYSPRLADAIGAIVGAGDFPVVLGGDCSILLAAALALRRVGRYGLAFVDGHLDFRHPGNAPAVGAVAGEDLAIVTGRGAAGLTDIDGLRPYVRDDDVVAFGFNEGPEDGEALDIVDTAIELMPLSECRALGMERAVATALGRLERAATRGFWIHLDVDVLDAAVMPAVDSPNPGGMTFEELRVALDALLASPRAVGIDVTVFDPELDPDGGLAERLVQLLEETLARQSELVHPDAVR